MKLEKPQAALNVRLGPTLQERLQEMAKREGVSMNALIVTYVVEGLVKSDATFKRLGK